MNNRVICGLWTCWVVSSSFGCSQFDAEDVKERELAQPTLAQGKSDALGGVNVVSTLEVGGEFAGTFDGDLQFFGHIFYSGETGSAVDIEVTQKGSSRGLDTTLFLYGERSPGDWQRLMVDDDDGWGALSKLGNVKFRGNFRRYMAVVGTADGLGRGAYRLTVTCTDGQCKAPAPVDASCPRSTLDSIEECVADASRDMQVSANEALKTCAKPGAAADYFDADCQVGAFGMPQPHCAQGFTVFNDVLYPACRTVLLGTLQGELTLQADMVSAELARVVDQEACALCVDDVEMYEFTASGAALSDVLFAVRNLPDHAPFQWKVNETLMFSTVLSAPLQAAVLAELDARDASDVSVAILNTDWAPAAGASEYIGLDVVVHWSSGRVIVIRSITGD